MAKTHTVLFVSRNKDNKHLDEHKQRSKTFLSDKSIDELMDKFDRFVDGGVQGEESRFYISVNARCPEKTRKALLHYFLDADNLPLYKYESAVVSVASKPKNRAENKWLFDYDDDQEKIEEFLAELRCRAGDDVIDTAQKTKSGYAVVVSKGFDTRELLDKWGNVSLHRDGGLFVSVKTKS